MQSDRKQRVVTIEEAERLLGPERIGSIDPDKRDSVIQRWREWLQEMGDNVTSMQRYSVQHAGIIRFHEDVVQLIGQEEAVRLFGDPNHQSKITTCEIGQ